MFVHTDLPGNRWNVVEAGDKKRARINMISHLLSTIPYEHVDRPPLTLPDRPRSNGYVRTERRLLNEVPRRHRDADEDDDIPGPRRTMPNGPTSTAAL